MISPRFTTRVSRPQLLVSVLTCFAFAAAIVVTAAETPAPAPGAAPTPAAPAEVQFMRDIAPILAQSCFSCHGDVKEPEGELRLDLYEGMIKGDHPAVVPYEPEQSAIIQRLTEEDSSSRMPRDGDPLTPAQIDLIRRWIADGAKFDGPNPKAPYKPTPPPASQSPSPGTVHPSPAH